MRYVRPLLLGAGAALLPFAVVVAFVWVRTGRGIGMDALLGRGELLPPAALMAGQALATSYGVPTPLRSAGWHLATNVCWSVLALAAALVPVPYSAATGYESRQAWLSIVAFAGAVAGRVTAVRWEPGGPP